MTGLFTSGILKYARACNPDCCFDDVVDDGLVTDSLLATTYRTDAGSEHSLTTTASISTYDPVFPCRILPRRRLQRRGELFRLESVGLLRVVEAGFRAMLIDDQPYREGEMTAETQRKFIIGVAVVAGLVALMNLLASAGPGVWDRLQPSSVAQHIQMIRSI